MVIYRCLAEFPRRLYREYENGELLPVVIVDHSEPGWGYRGSGSLALAKNILADVLCDNDVNWHNLNPEGFLSEKLAVKFRDEAIVCVNSEDDFVISRPMVWSWIQGQLHTGLILSSYKDLRTKWEQARRRQEELESLSRGNNKQEYLDEWYACSNVANEYEHWLDFIITERA